MTEIKFFKCSHPIRVKGRLVPCGKCISCRKKRIKDWTTRMLLEARNYKMLSFITLTYNDQNIPEDNSLSKRDLQLFIKRLRKQLDKENIKIKYFGCGEYGKKHMRPHYHLIVFGIDNTYYNIINKCWNKGFIMVEPVNYKTCRYVAKYCVKQFSPFSNSKGEFFNENGVLVEPQFILSSRCEALGRSYFEKEKNNMLITYINSGSLPLIELSRDFKVSPPKYFLEKIKLLLRNENIIRQVCDFLKIEFEYLESFDDHYLVVDDNKYSVPFYDHAPHVHYIKCSDFINLLERQYQEEINYCGKKSIEIDKIYYGQNFEYVKYRIRKLIDLYGYLSYDF